MLEIWRFRHQSYSVVFFIVMSGSSMTVAIVVSTVTIRIVTVSVAMIMTVVGRCDGNLEVIPCHVGKHTVLDVPSEIPLLRERVPILLRVHSPSKSLLDLTVILTSCFF